MPFAVMGINVVKAAWWSQLALDNPGVKRIYRHHPNSDELGFTRWMDDPEGAALDFAAFLVGHLSGVLDYIDLIAGDNEFILSKDYEPPERIALADQFMAAFVQEADLLLGKGVCVGNFNVGHWGPETVDYFPHTLAAIQAQALQGERLSYFCFHEYYWPLLRDDEHWYTGKFLRAMPPILERYPDVPCMITEVGIDKAACVWGEGHAGWRKTHDDINIAIEGYCGDHGLAWYNDLLNQTDYVTAALIFGCGMGDWRGMGFDIMNDVDDVAVLDRIKMYPVVAPPDPEPPPNGGDMIKIYDFNNNPFDPNAITTTWEWLRSIFGSVGGGIVRHPIEDKIALQPGDVVYKLEWIDCKVGESSCVIHVEDVNGSPEEAKYPVFGWPDAEPHYLPDKPSNWTVNGVMGPTNVNGDVGPGMGTGAYYDAATERGAHFVWIWDLPSDMVDGIGMLTWHPDVEGNHLHVNLGFRAVVWGDEPPEPPEPPTNGDLVAAVNRVSDELAGIRRWLEGKLPEPPEPLPDTDFFGEYFNNVSLDGDPVFTRTDEAVDFAWGDSSPDPIVTPNYFSARWVAKKTFEEATYLFSAYVDDGIRLYVDDELILGAWLDQPSTAYYVNVAMTAGQHIIRIEYYEQAGDATCQLKWKKL